MERIVYIRGKFKGNNKDNERSIFLCKRNDEKI